MSANRRRQGKMHKVQKIMGRELLDFFSSLNQEIVVTSPLLLF